MEAGPIFITVPGYPGGFSIGPSLASLCPAILLGTFACPVICSAVLDSPIPFAYGTCVTACDAFAGAAVPICQAMFKSPFKVRPGGAGHGGFTDPPNPTGQVPAPVEACTACLSGGVVLEEGTEFDL
jgi:hypothetical protein